MRFGKVLKVEFVDRLMFGFGFGMDDLVLLGPLDRFLMKGLCLLMEKVCILVCLGVDGEEDGWRKFDEIVQY